VAGIDKDVASLDASQAKAQEIYEKLEELSDSAEKVEDALKLVHGWKAWEKAHDEKVDSILKDAGLDELDMSPNRAKVTDLDKQYVALEHGDSHTSTTMSSTYRDEAQGLGSSPHRKSSKSTGQKSGDPDTFSSILTADGPQN